MMWTRRTLAVALAGATFLLSVATPVDAQRSRRSARRPATVRREPGPSVSVTIPRNQYFRLRMEDELSSDDSRVGDRFRATVVTPIYTGGREVIPAGSTVGGQVTFVQPARNRGREGAIGVRFEVVTLPSGLRAPIAGSLVELQDEEGAEMSEEGVLAGRSGTKKNVYFIGGGAAGGALLGGIIGGGKGAGIGTAVGAAAGIAGALLTKGDEAKVERGMEVGMALDRPATVRVRR